VAVLRNGVGLKGFRMHEGARHLLYNKVVSLWGGTEARKGTEKRLGERKRNTHTHTHTHTVSGRKPFWLPLSWDGLLELSRCLSVRIPVLCWILLLPGRPGCVSSTGIPGNEQQERVGWSHIRRQRLRESE
jgi:hypothetical protein